MRAAILTFGAALPLAAAILPAVADPTPVIVTYEQRKARQDEHLLARDPKAFWVHQILTRLQSRKPSFPKPLKQAAAVKVTFVVAHDGHVVSKVVSQSSGNEIADKAALQMVERSDPFPPMPAALPPDDQTFTLPVRFK